VHWSWQPIRAQSPPEVKSRAWPKTAIDNFILAPLESKGLAPAADAHRRTLIRRVYFDLIGLPPTPRDVDAFLNDTSPRAYEKIVDHLLASPHYGERWARHWLDLVRYGESRGHEFDYLNPNAYQYRDYVIRAFNDDVPYDRFVVEHIAGDLLKTPRLHPAEGFNESILGTGFWFLGEQVHSPVDICQDKADRFDNMLDVMGKAFLGLTVACARCHDHKFDAISTKDYYSLFGFLESSSYRLARFDSMEHDRRVAEQLWKLREQSRPAIQKALAESWQPGVRQLADYLLAARDVMQSGPLSAAKSSEIAAARKLDADMLSRWGTHLLAAEKDKADPFHAWARVATAKDWKAAALVLHSPTGEANELAADLPQGTEVIVDYRSSTSKEWLPDGVAFGPGPARPGDACFGTSSEKPIPRFSEHAAAQVDPVWDRLRLASGTETEPGALAGFVRPGRMLRTPTFRVNAGTVYYLVKGAGQVYASVDGHVMIAGPLHGGLITSFRGEREFRWVAHNLAPYRGRLAHIEFTPGDADFAVAMVVQGDRGPDLARRPNRALLKMLSGANSVDGLARAYQSFLSEVAERVESDQLREASADYAMLANWMLQRQELFVRESKFAALQAAAKRFISEQEKLVAQIRTESRLAPAMLDGNGVDEHVYIRGSYKAPGPTAPRRFLEALAGPEPIAARQGSGRLELARQMIDPAADPYLPRVMVNRLWHHLFGRGIVASVDNFGVLGDRPTHPELLDFLADRFVKDGWSIKRMIRLMVLSRTYQMSSRPDKQAGQADPENLLLSHMRIRRLEGEAIRDAMLAVSGRLDPKLFGPSVPVNLTSCQEGRGRPASGPLDGNGRRSLYLSVHRNFLPAMLLAFDTPIPFSTVGRRTVSNVPAQALILLNDPFVHQQAEVWARKELDRGGAPQERITRMYLAAFSRPPSAVELCACVEFLQEQTALRPGNEVSAWASLAHTLFNVKEFIFLN
jgi:hypothetical protein